MMRKAFLILIMLPIIFTMNGASGIIVADSLTHHPLPGASVFDRQGNIIGISNSVGYMPYISPNSYPITIRYLGFKELCVPILNTDTVYMTEITTELPEVLVESRQHKVLHMLGYVREYSTLSTYTDTVSLFREKMVDYMLTPSDKVKIKGWRNPRVLKSRSYYRFTNAYGLDSVSDKCNYHFSWSDWIRIIASPTMANGVKDIDNGTDTLYGKYGPTEIWMRNNDKVIVDINVLADTISRKWVSNLSTFFEKHFDFEKFKLRFNYGNVASDSIYPSDLIGYSFNIESNGRGIDMFMFNSKDEPFFVSTYAEIYILDKEYITVKEAKKWDGKIFVKNNFEIIEPAEAPELQVPVKELISRVNAINHDNIRLDFTPDYSLVSRGVRKQNIGQRAFLLLKQITGISKYKFHRNSNRKWNEFRKKQMTKNNN